MSVSDLTTDPITGHTPDGPERIVAAAERIELSTENSHHDE